MQLNSLLNGERGVWIQDCWLRKATATLGDIARGNDGGNTTQYKVDV